MKTYLVSLFLLFSVSFLNAQVIRVPADQTSIQAAIEAASEGDTVLVDEGLYYENINFLGKAITVTSHFILDADTSHISKTIIDGSQAIHADRASVVRMISGEDTTSVLMGFTITGGEGSRLTMKWGTASYPGLWGGGIAINNSGGLISHNIIEKNNLGPRADLDEIYGGALTAIVNNNHSLIVRNNIMSNNTVTGYYAYGGGAFLAGGRIIFEKNIISENACFASYHLGSPGVFWANYGNAGVINDVVIKDNMITENKGYSETHGGTGGALSINFNIYDEAIQVCNNVIANNYFDSNGAGLALYKTKATVSNNTIWNNESLAGCNSVELVGPSNVVMFNNIIRSNIENSLPEFSFKEFGTSTFAVWNNILKEHIGNDKVNTRGNEYEEPVFLPDSYELAEDSPGIGWGADSLYIKNAWLHAPLFDIYGQNRAAASADHKNDIGAVETSFEQTEYAYNSEDVLLIPDEQPSIQAGINKAKEGDTVLVREGLYYENINFQGKAITVASKYILGEDESYLRNTVINGSESNNTDTASVVTFWSGEDTTSVLTGFTITGGKGTYVTGIHTAWNLDYYGGGGILIYNSGAKITDNIIEENNIIDPLNKVRGALGCGILATVNNNHTAIIRNNKIRFNTGTDNGAWGGGLSLHGGRFLVENNSISHNTLRTTSIYAVGAGIMWEYESQSGSIGETVIRNNLISENKALSTSGGGGGGGICFSMRSGSGVPQLYNNIIIGNIVEGIGGALYGWESRASIYNNTFIDNAASKGGNCISMEGNASFLLFNNIFWNFADNDKPDYYFLESGNSIKAYNNILNTPFSDDQPVEEENNIYKNPIIIRNTNELREASPGVGIGLSSLEVGGKVYHAPPYDINGNPRPHPIDKYPDIGAIESPHLYIDGIKDFNNLSLRVYPNPSNGLLSIETEVHGHHFITITSINGQVLLSEMMDGNSHQLDISSLSNGVYFVTIQSDEAVGTRKIIKLRN